MVGQGGGVLMKKYVLNIFYFLLHLLAIGLIIYLVWPVGRWYLNQVPARGTDLYLSASYVSHLLDNFAFRFNGWKEIWYTGVPYNKDYPSFYFYLMLPLAARFGLIPGIQLFAVAVLFAFGVFSYFLYFSLAKNPILALALALATLFSANLYRPLVWAGGIPFWTTQAFYPLVLFLVVKYCQSENKKWLFLAALATGLGIRGHPQSFLNVIFPSAFLLLFLWRPSEKKVGFKNRFLSVVAYGIASILVALPEIWERFILPDFLNVLRDFITLSRSLINPPTSTGGALPLSGTAANIEDWTKAQFSLVWTDSSSLLWFALVIGFSLFVVSLFFRKNRLRGLLSLLPFGLVALLVVGLVFLYSRGISFYVTGWYKAFWPVLVAVAGLAAFLWGEAGKVFIERQFFKNQTVKIFHWTGVILGNLLLVAAAFFFLVPDRAALLERLPEIDNASSAFPEILNVKTSNRDLKQIALKLKPKLMTDRPRDYRLYLIDATVNIWWGALEEVPLTRGYVDPPLSMFERGGIFWLDSALGPTDTGPKSSLIEDWKVSEEVADNNLYFLLDWYATRYLEGNHLSAASSMLASNVTADKFIEAEETVEIEGSIVDRYTPQEHWDPGYKQSLNFYRVKQDLVSPILMTTEAAPLMHIGDQIGYDILQRFFGMMNLGPRQVVLVKGPKYIDELGFADLTNFDALILYQYDYHNPDKAWSLIEDYLEKGGKVFIDTGTEVRETDTVKLPSRSMTELPVIFPLKRVIREDLGQEWELEAAPGSLTEGVDFTKFSPLLFNGGVWNISHPPTEADLRPGAQVILRQQGKPVVVIASQGSGTVIWSGVNLPYHVIREYNQEEGRFFEKLLSELVSFSGGETTSNSQFISPRERPIKVSNSRGVLFKEQFYDGWQATLNGKDLDIYKAGPSSPGFMYVKLPKNAVGEVRFKYSGSLVAKFYSAVSLVTILFILDYLLGGKTLIALIRFLFKPVKQRTASWWEKDDEY